MFPNYFDDTRSADIFSFFFYGGKTHDDNYPKISANNTKINSGGDKKNKRCRLILAIILAVIKIENGFDFPVRYQLGAAGKIFISLGAIVAAAIGIAATIPAALI